MADNRIRIQCDDYEACINVELFFSQCSLKSVRKLFKLMFGQPYSNIAAIEYLLGYIPHRCAELHAEWHDASFEYQNNYRLPTDPKIERENRKMLEDVKKCKRSYEKMTKIMADFVSYKPHLIAGITDELYEEYLKEN